MLTQLLEVLTSSHSASNLQLVVQNFVDVEMDVEGWYALGHHAPKTFFAAVSEHESLEQLEQNDVEYLWATFAGNHFELFDQIVPESSPVTVVRLF